MEKEKFEQIECKELVVKNDNGSSISLSFDDDMPNIILTDKDGKNGLTLAVNHRGGIITIRDNQGDIKASIQIGEEGEGLVLSRSRNDQLFAQRR